MSNNLSRKSILSAPALAAGLVLASCGAVKDAPTVVANSDQTTTSESISTESIPVQPPRAAASNSFVYDPSPFFDEFIDEVDSTPLSELTIGDFFDTWNEVSLGYPIEELEGRFVPDENTNGASDSQEARPGWVGAIGDRAVVRLFTDDGNGTISRVSLAMPGYASSLDSTLIKLLLAASEGSTSPFAGLALLVVGDRQLGQSTISGGNNSIWYCITEEDLTDVGLGPSVIMTVVDSSEGPSCHEDDFFARNVAPIGALVPNPETWNDDENQLPNSIDFELSLKDWEPGSEGQSLNSATVASFQETWYEMWHPGGEMTLVEYPPVEGTIPGTAVHATLLHDDTTAIYLTTDAETGAVLEIRAQFPIADGGTRLSLFADAIAAVQGNLEDDDSLLMVQKAINSPSSGISTGGNDNLWFCIFRDDRFSLDGEATMMIQIVDASHGGRCLSDDFAPRRP